MRRSQYTSKFSAVLLGSLLAVAFGSASQSARHLQDPVHGILPARAEKEPHETGGDLLSHVRSSGAASPKAEPVDAGDAESLRSHALHFGPHADVNFPNQIPLPRYFPGYFNKHNYAAVREAEPKHVDPADNQVKPPESGRPKRSTDSRMKDNKGDNGDHPLLDEPGAKVHCWNEANAFDVVLPASEVAKHFPHECQHPLSCNTTCVAKVPGRDVCARLKSECTVPETQLGTSQNENKQLASFEKNVERHLGELDAKLAQLSLESSNHKDKLVKLDHNLNRSSNAREEQFSAALVKILDSLDRKAAEMRSLFTEKNKQLASFEKNVERRLGELDAKLSQLSLESSNHKDKFVKLDHNMNRLSNARKEQFSAALVKILASLDRKAAEMKSLFNEKSESMMTTESSILSLIQSDSKTHLWTLKGYAALKADSIKHGQYSNWGPKVYIGRYLISWGITFVKRTDGVNLHLRVQLHKGINDEFLEWPFSNELKLSILHPESGEKQEGREKPQMVASDIKYYVRPIEVSNPGVYFSSIKFDASYLELSGYVKTDQLLLKLEMLS